MNVQSDVNIGLVGHVDHGKTTLTKALSGVWTDTHSEETKRGISIRLGYADIEFRKCPKCGEPECYTTSETCQICGSETELIRKVSFVDAPGHETLMATMLSGAAIMDGAVLVIAANESCPQPQAIESYNEIKEFVKGTCAEDALIIPVSAQQGANVDILIETMLKQIQPPERNFDDTALMHVARSFDINKPGSGADKIKGGVIGGTLVQGTFKLGDTIEIRPGPTNNGERLTLKSEIIGLEANGEQVEEIGPGGLVGIATKLDPSLTKSDSLSGTVAGEEGTLPDVLDSFTMEANLLDRVVGTKEERDVAPIKIKEPLMINCGTTTTIGVVTSTKKNNVDVALKLPVCASPGDRVALSRRVGARWRLIGYGIIK